MLHVDAKGHGGIIITYGGTIVATKSVKLVTTSSTESELVAVEESVPYVLWILTLLQDLGLNVQKPASLCKITYQQLVSSTMVKVLIHQNTW